MARLARDHEVIVSIGDADEDEAASLAAGVPFVRITDRNMESVWPEIAALIEKAMLGIDDPVTRLFGK